jgi:hypothetical protein
MKTVLMLTLCLLASTAQASDFLMGMVVGNMMSGSDRVVTKEVQVDKFSMVVAETHKQMDMKINQNIPLITIDYQGLNVEEFAGYFKMKNFQVLQDQSKLTFNLSKFVLNKLNNEQNDQWAGADQKRQTRSFITWMCLGFILFVTLVTINEGAALGLIMVFNLAWVAGSGKVIFPRTPTPAQITQLPEAIKGQLPVVWQEAKK